MCKWISNHRITSKLWFLTRIYDSRKKYEENAFPQQAVPTIGGYPQVHPLFWIRTLNSSQCLKPDWQTPTIRITGMMRSEDEIRKRIDEIEKRLSAIGEAIDNELAYPFFERRKRMFWFLGCERRIYRAILLELRSTLNE
jgi:hypothetical protein